MFGGCSGNSDESKTIEQKYPSWKTFSDGNIRWKENCDFYGDDFKSLYYDKNDCAYLCEDHPDCNYFTWANNICYLKTKPLGQQPTYLENGLCGWIEGRRKLAKLINYWPMSNLKDIIGGAHLYGGINYEFTYDRFQNPKSALGLNKGYIQVPSGVYFDGDFTITLWIKINSYQSWSRIIDFGGGSPLDNVIVSMHSMESRLYVDIFDGTNTQPLISSPQSIQLGSWYHIAYVLSGNYASVYLDGKLATSSFQKLNRRYRTQNYIGRSYTTRDSYADAVYDDLKIYSGTLSEQEIRSEAFGSSECKNLFVRDELKRKRRAFNDFNCFLNEQLMRPRGTNAMMPDYWNPIVEVIRNPINNRVEWLRARIYRRHLNGGSTTNTATRAYARLMGDYQDQAGHIVANILGGTGRETYNIFPQNANINMGSWRVQERNIFELVSMLPSDDEYIEATYGMVYDSSTATRPIYFAVRLVRSNGFDEEFIASGPVSNF
ncbi:unnamed protein product [Brachionus calyciflorus]|uniref:Type VII secretion system protein EssD-like domain-containing protein n=1 Tax=Brachionus calyciflorus TaxID=104777 RepID=A0A813X1M2_9BILA|nr:unnamed protein product [Brachionus calyciflorus]